MTTGAWGDITQADLLVDGKYIDDPEGLNIGGPVLDATITRSIEQASTIKFTMFDPQHDLLNSRLVTEKIKCNVGPYSFKLAAVEKSGDNIILTFEDEAVSILRDHATPRKASRAKVTRAQFAQMLVKEEPKLTLYTTELKIKQPVQSSKQTPSQKTRDGNKEYGFPTDIPGSIKIRGVKATSKQLHNADAILRQGTQMGADKFTLITAIAVAIDESNIIAVDRGDAAGPDSRGIYQQRDNGAWSTAPKGSAQSLADRMDPAHAALEFFVRAIRVRHDNPSLSYTELGHAVQGNADPNVYAQFVSEAKAIYDFWSGIIPSLEDSSTATSSNAKKPYEFHRGGPGQRGEDSWQCLLRLAQEVNWLCFAVGFTIYFLPAVDLYRSRPIVTLDESTPGVESIDFQYDLGKNVTTATITVHAERWQVDPGAVIIIQNMGPANGRWLVSEIDRSMFDTQATISLIKPTAPLPEPANSNVTGAKGKGKLTANGELNGLTVVEVGLSLQAPPPAYQMDANHPGVSLNEYLTKHKTEKPPFDCSSFARWIWIVGGHVDIGDSNVAGQVAHAKTTKWLQGGPGTQPPGGFKEGDVLSLHNFSHTVVCAGGTDTIEAKGKNFGIVKGDMPSSWDYWYRPEPPTS